MKECLNSVISVGNNGFPEISAPEFCIGCGRCMARCPADAIRLNGLQPAKFKPVPAGPLISPEHMALFLQAKRSCRQFRPEKPKKAEFELLFETAQTAPTSINSQEKTYVLIQDDAVISAIRNAILQKSRFLYHLFRALIKSPLFFLMPKESRAYFIRLTNDYRGLIENARKGKDHLFHNAPCLVFFTGIGADPSGKDNALHAMSYFMLLAQSMGIGTCINGFCMIWPKLLARFVKIPRLYKIYGVLTAGYEAAPFRKTIYRKEAETCWLAI